MVIEINRTSELEDGIKRKLNNLVKKEFGQFSIVQQTKWSAPDWTFIYYLNGKIVSFLNIVERNIMMDGIIYTAAGLNNLITIAPYRGMGYSGMLLENFEHFIFGDLKKELGVLLCAKNLVGYYQRFNWYQVNCEVIYSQSRSYRYWKAETMLRSQNITYDPNKIN